MTKDKLLENKKNLIIAGSIALILIIAIIFTIKIVNSSKNNQLSNFEKITIYGYLENFMKPPYFGMKFYFSSNSKLRTISF